LSTFHYELFVDDASDLFANGTLSYNAGKKMAERKKITNYNNHVKHLFKKDLRYFAQSE